MKILDKYILKKILTTFIFVVLILVAIIVVIDTAEKNEKFTNANLTSVQIIGYYLDVIPWMAGLITPLVAFIAVVYVTSVMAGHTEIIAILSGGVSFRRFLYPYFIAGAVIASVSFFLNGWVIPKSNRSRLAFELHWSNKNTDRRNIHLQLEPQVYMFMQNYSSASTTGYQFSLERFDSNRLIEKLIAQNIEWDSTKQKWKLRYWEIKKIDKIFSTHRSADSLKLSDKGNEKDTTLAVSPKDFENDDRKYDGMTTSELNDYIAKLKFRGTSGVEYYEVEKQVRYASPFSIFVLVFMGVVVSSRKSRGGTGFQIALGFLLSFVFIIFFTMSRIFAETGTLPALLAVWIPNVLFALIAIALYKFTPR
jgi:lipopolysaccharide export system permease protein